MRAEFDLRLDVIESALAVKGGCFRFVFLLGAGLLSRSVFNRGIRRAGAVSACQREPGGDE
jgi:hypothetical protein